MAGPKAYRGIMVSSTFSDLEEHRREVIGAIEKLGFRANVMEISGARAGKDIIHTSIDMVRDSAAFVGVIGHRYGQTPKCPDRNPDALSISELEFNEALRLRRPILLFIMGDKHPVTIADVESVAEKKVKLDAFRERAKQMGEGSTVERIYEMFNSREEFAKAAAIAMGKLSQALPPHSDGPGVPDEPATFADSIETALPPDLRAVPRHLGSHDFVGRAAELSKLDDWCGAADQHPMLLFEAIGGSGKSMVTWTWLTDRATKARSDWAGRFWFSFYEGGATMTRFCREALAYMTGQPAKAFRKERIRALMPRLIAELEARPWLIVLDGLERILVAYHRIDAAQMRDEDVEAAQDQIADRDPRAAINPEDEELLRQLTAAAPSKILVTSRLTPQALINRSGMPMPGVRREILPGLRPPDAETLLRACGVGGDSKAMQDYLQRNCDCHPLVIGALAGLVNNYMPDRGNFDVWLADPEAGGRLGLADMDLTQRRNHILDAAIEALPEPARRLLQTLSLLQGGTDYATLKEFNPHRPPQPEKAKRANWRRTGDEEAGEQSPDLRTALAQFDETLTELERRGLLQYEHSLKRYDLHPVVRGVAAGRMGEAEAGTIGSRVVDYFSSRPHDPFQQAETLEELAPGIQIVATLTRIGEFDRALSAYYGDLHLALSYNLIAYRDIQRLLRPFFPQGWDGPLAVSGTHSQSNLLVGTGNALIESDPSTAQRLYARNLRLVVAEEIVSNTIVGLDNFARTLERLGKLDRATRIRSLALDLAEASGSDDFIFGAMLFSYVLERQQGRLDRADTLWARLDPMGRNWIRAIYVGGDAEAARADDLFSRGALTGAVLAEAETLCREGRNRAGVCHCLSLRGKWHLSRDEPNLALEPLNEALRLYREAGQENMETEALLALAQLRAGDRVDARAVAERLDGESDHETAFAVAELWHELDDRTRAVAAALRAHKSACDSGEPYVYRSYLDRADALLCSLGETPPEVPKHDPANDEVFDWEDDVRALIEKTRKKHESRLRRAAEGKEKKPEA